MKHFRVLLWCLGAVFCLAGGSVWASSPRVTLQRPPEGGIQPQAVVDGKGVVHLIYFKGEPRSGDLFYVHREPRKNGWSAPVRVNSQPGSAVAAGTIRGGQIAVGKGGRIHVTWNGSQQALPRGAANPRRAQSGQHGPGQHGPGQHGPGQHGPGQHGPAGGSPMLYTRMNDAGTGFEPQRNLMQSTFALDGGGTVTADRFGTVYVAWHAHDGSGEGEEGRRMWVARSRDEGKTFAREAPIYAEPTGACACCGTRAFADSRGTVYVLYRSAKAKVNRDMYLLASRDRGESYRGALIHPWKVPG